MTMYMLNKCVPTYYCLTARTACRTDVENKAVCVVAVSRRGVYHMDIAHAGRIRPASEVVEYTRYIATAHRIEYH